MQKNIQLIKQLPAIVMVGIVAVVLYVTGIGCPIKFLTGISCPGCGMTRAWLSALSMRFDLALAYHPLFWIVPILVVVAAARTHIDHRVFQAVMLVSLLAILAVWIARLVNPHDANMLCSGLAQEDVVSIEVPRWLVILQTAKGA